MTALDQSVLVGAAAAAADDDDDEGFGVVTVCFAVDVLESGALVLVKTAGVENRELPLTEDRPATYGDVVLSFFISSTTRNNYHLS